MLFVLRILDDTYLQLLRNFIMYLAVQKGEAFRNASLYRRYPVSTNDSTENYGENFSKGIKGKILVLFTVIHYEVTVD